MGPRILRRSKKALLPEAERGGRCDDDTVEQRDVDHPKRILDAAGRLDVPPERFGLL